MLKKLFLVVGLLALVFGLGDPVVFAQAGTLPATLDWTNPLDATDGIQVEKGPSLTGPFVVLKQIPANSITFTDSTNAIGDKSCYRLGYFNGFGVGPYSGSVCKSFQVPATAPPTPAIK